MASDSFTCNSFQTLLNLRIGFYLALKLFSNRTFTASRLQDAIILRLTI